MSHRGKADAEGRDTWVLSSNTANNKFYASLGFVTRTELVLGRDDTTRSDSSVVCSLVSTKSSLRARVLTFMDKMIRTAPT